MTNPDVDRLIVSMEMAAQALVPQIERMERMWTEATEKVEQVLAAQAEAEQVLAVFREALRDRQALLMDVKAAAAGENPVEDVAALYPRMVALGEKLAALERSRAYRDRRAHSTHATP